MSQAKLNTLDDRPDATRLLASIKAALPALEKILADVDGEWGTEDGVYRFYHQSWKVYYLQDWTEMVVSALRGLAPDRDLNPRFLEVVKSGTGKTFSYEHNWRWLEETRPIVEAHFHARYFLGMVVKYGEELDHPPGSLPSGWASVLYLYGLR